MRMLIQPAIDITKRMEGFRAKSYKCPAGIWTIGYGHTENVLPSDEVSLYQAELMLKQDLEWAQDAIEDLVHVPLTDGQYGALVDFVFNVGRDSFAKSTLLKKLNEKRYEEVPSEMRKWVKAGNKILPGLVARREAEAALFADITEDSIAEHVIAECATAAALNNQINVDMRKAASGGKLSDADASLFRREAVTAAIQAASTLGISPEVKAEADNIARMAIEQYVQKNKCADGVASLFPSAQEVRK